MQYNYFWKNHLSRNRILGFRCSNGFEQVTISNSVWEESTNGELDRAQFFRGFHGLYPQSSLWKKKDTLNGKFYCVFYFYFFKKLFWNTTTCNKFLRRIHIHSSAKISHLRHVSFLLQCFYVNIWAVVILLF